MFPINVRQLGSIAVSAAAAATLALFAPGAAFAQRIITIVIPGEPDSLRNCNSPPAGRGRAPATVEVTMSSNAPRTSLTAEAD